MTGEPIVASADGAKPTAGHMVGRLPPEKFLNFGSETAFKTYLF